MSEEDLKKLCREERKEAMKEFFQGEYEKFKAKIGGYVINLIVIAAFMLLMKLFFLTNGGKATITQIQSTLGN